MRFGPPRGDSNTLELTVTDDLATHVVPGAPPLCTAPALLQAADEVARTLLTPHLETGEVATVVSLDIHLRGPLPVGAQLTLTATVASVTSGKLVCEVLVRRGSAIVARGSVEHLVVDGREYAGQIAEAAPTVTG
ncbi:thioesterase family protein [Nitriliruptor alkaliphilus]|uniref:thioesterase family protein n=1 Tax=Nitriliruptor alkaliphilus TaxID=427918 RepID=UPI000697A60F|nr:hotdog domain-containing protein [Nitriliruptor alkaliphilus]